MWAVKNQGVILERDKKKLPSNKRLAIHRLLQSITRIDYQCLNKPIKWEDDLGEHKGSYHPMDLMHFLIKNLDTPSRSKLYQKFSVCKLALPVLFPNNDHVYMDVSLRQVKITWKSGGRIVEGDVTNAPVPIISMIRCGQQSPGSFSKSKLANDLLNFKCDAKIGSCGFFTKDSKSHNNLRKVAKGTVEGMWFEGKSDRDFKGKSGLDTFQTSFGLLNLRGDALQHVETGARLASCSDVVFMFCDVDMFKDTRYENLLKDAAKILKAKEKEQRKINKLFVVFNKDAQSKVKENRAIFEDISNGVVWEKMGSNYQKFLSSITEKIQNSLNDTSMNLKKPTLNSRLRQENKESSTENVESAKRVTDFILEMMHRIKNADEDQRIALRESLFPLQSTIKCYAKTQREERRSLNNQEKSKLGDKLIAFRNERFQKIKEGLPEIMSSFFKEIFKSRTVDEKLMFVCNIQYSLDDWCSKYLFDIRMQYSDSLKQLTLLKDEEIKKRESNEVNVESPNKLRKNIQVENKKCANLSKLLLDMSVGIESIFREMGEIFETTKRYKDSIKEIGFCNKKLPELAASLIMKGVAIEIMDGDGLSVPTGWIEEVMRALNTLFKETYGMKKDPKIFVLTVLGTQSTGKSTLLNTMFGVQFPVSAGRCTKGAFMQLTPVFMDNFLYNGLIIIDTEGLGAPEYRQDSTHDNEIATFVLGISDLAIINVRGELPTNIENFLQVSTCALMRMSMVDFQQSVIFVHQNCDPSSKEKNLTGRHTFMKVMDEAVSMQARLIQKQDRFNCFKDIVNISFEDDFVYFPQLLEGSPPMSPPSGDYSESCSNLTSYIITKMQNYKNAQTLQEFAGKVKLIWKGILEENFVLSLINSAEIQVKHDIDNQMSHLKLAMENYLENILDNFCGEIKANFNAKEPSKTILREKEEKLEKELFETKKEKKKSLKDHIEKQTLNQPMYKNWEQKCINEIDRNSELLMKKYLRKLNDYYNHEENDSKLRYELQQIRYSAQLRARKVANNLIKEKEKGAGKNNAPEFSDHEIDNEFQKLWNSEKKNFVLKRQKIFTPCNVKETFIHEIGSKYGHVANFQKISSLFGMNLENQFDTKWIDSSHVEFQRYIFKVSDAELFENMSNLIAETEYKIFQNVIGLYEVKEGGLRKMHFQPDSTTFDCERLAKQYLAQAIDILMQTHKESQQVGDYNLTDTFKAMFAFHAAQYALKNFEKAQQSFIDHMGISTNLEIEKENIKQIFTLILKQEETLSIAAKQITQRLHQGIKEAALKQVINPCKEILLQLVTQKMHVHGLVLHDIVDMVDIDICEEKSNYMQEYFSFPLKIFRKKMLHVFDGCPDIRLNNLVKEKFDTAARKIKEIFKNNLQPSEKSLLIEVICQNSFIRKLGISQEKFDGIIMPQMSKDKPQKFVTISCNSLSENGTERTEKEVKKRMQDETDIIEKLKISVSEIDGTSTDLTLQQVADIKEKIINDVFDHLFECSKMCPFCNALCDETHLGEAETDSKHRSHCHRPICLVQRIEDETGKAVTMSCNDAVQSEHSFKKPDKGSEWVCFRDYRKVNSYYESWDIDGISSDQKLYWKYIMYHSIRNECSFKQKFGLTVFLVIFGSFTSFIPEALLMIKNLWGRIFKFDAKENINSLFHLDKNSVAKNEDGFHYIKRKVNHSL